MPSVFDRVAKAIGRVLITNVNNVTPESTARDFDGWDSVTHTYIILSLEEEFGVELPVEETISAENVGGLVQLIETELAKKA